MQVKINEENYSFTQDEKGIEQLLELIDNQEKETELSFDHMIVNGQEHYINVVDVLELHNKDTNTVLNIEVKFATKEQQITNLLQSAHEYVKGASPIILSLSEKFYNRPSGEDWTQIVTLFESLEYISSVLAVLNTNIPFPGNEPYARLIGDMDQNVEELQAALNSKDYSLVADILKYEIHTIYSNLVAYTQQ